MKGIYKYCIDDDDVDRLDVILENCPLTIPLRYILTSDDCSACNSYYILHL